MEDIVVLRSESKKKCHGAIRELIERVVFGDRYREKIAMNGMG